MNPEEMLRTTLRQVAHDAQDTVTFEEVRRAARLRRRGSRRRTAVLAAAAVVVAVGAPTAFLLRPSDDEPSPAPAPTASPTGTATQSAGPSSTATPDPLAEGMRELPETGAPGLSYLQGSTIHLVGGGTTALPGDGPFGPFAGYHGGWLVGDPQLPGTRWYDGNGDLRRQSEGGFRLAVSPDGMRTAFSMDGKLLIGITTGMGEGEEPVGVSRPDDAWPVGFLAEGALVYMDGGQVRTDQAIGEPLPSSMVEARAVSADDVVAGVDNKGEGLAWSARTGAILWQHSSWSVTAFSTDGRYAAAASTYTSSVAILDTQTGDVVRQFDFNQPRVLPTSDPVIDTDGSLLVSIGDGDNLDQSVLRLEPDGAVSRATKVFPLDPGSDSEQIRFAAGP